MAQWDFPVTIQPNTTASVYVEWSERAFKRKQDDSAEAYYTLENAPSGQNFTFQIRARWDHDVSKNGDFSLQVCTPRASSLRLVLTDTSSSGLLRRLVYSWVQQGGRQ